MKKILLSTAIVIATVGSFLGQTKEGAITYDITVDGLPPEQAAMMSGMELKIFFKEGKSRQEMSSAFFTSTTITADNKTTVLMDQMGQKFYFEVDPNEKKDTKKEDAKIEYKDETKKIAGYDCKKAVIKDKNEKGEDVTMTVWYTEQLPYSGQGGGRGGNSSLKNLKGAPLEFGMNQGPMTFMMTANDVSKSAVPDSKFVVNTDGYTKMSKEDMENMRKGGGK